MSSAVRASRNQAYGLAAATSVNGASSAAHGPTVLGGVVPGPGRHHAFEQRVDVDGRQQPDGHLRRADPGEVVAHHRVRREVGRDPARRGMPAARRARDDRMASAPAINVTERAPGGDVGGGPVDQPLRAVAADRRHLAGAPGVRAEPSGQFGGRGRAGAGHDVHHRQPVDPVTEGGGRGQGLLAGPRHQVDRRHQLGALDGLAGRHHHRDALGVVGRWCSSGGGGHARVRGASYHRHPTGTGTTRTGTAPGKVGTLSSDGQPPTSAGPPAAGPPRAPAHGGGLADDFLFGVATAGFQIEGGYNGPGQPANNWLGLGAGGSGRALGRAPSASGSGRRSPWTGPPPWAATASGWASSGPGWFPNPTEVDRAALARYAAIVQAASTAASSRWSPSTTSPTRPGWATTSGSGPTRPSASGPGPNWPSASLAPTGAALGHHQRDQRPGHRHWLLGMFPPGRVLASGTRPSAVDNLLAAHVARLRGHPPGPARRRRHHQQLVHEHLRVRPPCSSTCCWPAAWASNGTRWASGWPSAAANTTAPFPRPGPPSTCCAGFGAVRSPYGAARLGAGRLDDSPLAGLLRTGPPGAGSPGTGSSRTGKNPAPGLPGLPSRAVQAVYDSPHRAHPRRHRARLLRAGGLAALPAARPPHVRRAQPASRRGSCGTTCRIRLGLTRLAEGPGALTPGDLPVWVVENGMCNRVRRGRSLSPPGRLGPSPLSAGEHRRGDGGRRRGRPGPGLLALVAGRQLRVGIVRAAVRALRCRPPPRRARDDAGWRRIRWGTMPLVPTGGSSPGCGRGTGRCSRADGAQAAVAPALLRAQAPVAPALLALRRRRSDPGRPAPARPGPRSGRRGWLPASGSGWPPPPARSGSTRGRGRSPRCPSSPPRWNAPS